jgi:hypothetical protein
VTRPSILDFVSTLLVSMHDIYTFQISGLILHDSVFIILHIFLDYFLFFPLLVDKSPRYSLLLLSIFASLFCNVPCCDVLAFIRSSPFILFHAFRLIAFFPRFLKITRPDIPFFPPLVSTILHFAI